VTNQEYREILEKLGFRSARAFAPVLGVSVRTSQLYAEDAVIPGPVARLMRLLAAREITPNRLKELD
jgi:hypothetical protein